MKHFVFIEFTSSRLRYFLQELRQNLQGKPDPDPIHITVRGPYSRLPDRQLLARLEDSIAGYGVVLGGAGIFQVPKGYCVYIKAQSPVFAEVWWKRDFPSSEYGIHPHITIFESKRSEFARRVQSFLRTERLEIVTFSLRLTVPTSRQLPLFEIDTHPKRPEERGLYEKLEVRPGFLQRAAALGKSLREECPGDA